MLHFLFSGRENNFVKTDPRLVTTQGVPYDYRSIMHYSARAFSRNGQPTIVPRDNNVPLSALGQRESLTVHDLLHATELYCPGEWNLVKLCIYA